MRATRVAGALGRHADEAVEVGRHLHDRPRPVSPSRDSEEGRVQPQGSGGREAGAAVLAALAHAERREQREDALREESSSQRRSRPVQPEGLATASPSRASAGRISARHSYCRAMISRERRDTAASCSAGLMPEPSGVASPERSWALSEATRTMKNSSKLDETIARNFIRSRRGFVRSRASSRIRALNSSHESSRLK